jgi:IS30 family transposase
MGKEYKHLSLEERDKITEMKVLGYSLTEIGKALGRDKSTISREVSKNSSPKHKLYLSHRAHERAINRRKEAYRRPKLKCEEIASYVRSKLELGWSPEQIAGRIGIEHPGLYISHEAIYQYIYHPKTPDREELIGYLRRAHRKRKRKGVNRRERRTKIPNRIPIEARPACVEERMEFGHWEGDSLVSRKSLVALNSLVERTSKLLYLTKMKRKTAEETHRVVVERLNRLPQTARLTITMDNGTENAKHQDITAAIGTKCYFAHPYASWERGTNENTNGLVRWYLPKGTDFSKITDEQIRQIESLINNRPRKCLGYKTPLEAASPYVALQG